MLTFKEKVFDAVKQWPGVTRHELKAVVDGHGNISARLADLFNNGLIRKELVPNRSGGRNMHEMAYWANEGAVVKCRKPPTRTAAVTVAVDARLADMQAQLAALADWQRQALERHPDLAVPPILLAARKIAAKLCREDGDEHGAKQFERGDRDKTLIIRAVMVALEETV